METKLAPLVKEYNRDLKWFTQQIGSFVLVVSENYTGPVKVEDHEQARQFYLNQEEGYTFNNLADWIKQAANYPASDYCEPELNKKYLFNFYINGKLEESKLVEYAGLTDNLKWYIFTYVNGTDNAGNTCHLLKVGHFPKYQSLNKFQETVLEQYISVA